MFFVYFPIQKVRVSKVSFGDRLRNLRLENNLTQEDLSKKLNVSRATVGRYETNERFPDKDTLKNIADVFNVSIDYLLERTSNKNTDAYLSKSFNDKHMKDIAYKEVYDEIIKILILENLIDQERYVPREILEDIMKYGIDAAIKIAKLQNKIKEKK